MATTGTNEIDAHSAYAQSFGNLKHLTRYSDASANLDMREINGALGGVYAANIKAFDVANASSGTTDKAIIPIYLDPQIIDRTRKFTPLVEIDK